VAMLIQQCICPALCCFQLFHANLDLQPRGNQNRYNLYQSPLHTPLAYSTIITSKPLPLHSKSESSQHDVIDLDSFRRGP
jgi:hypothetical protein